MSRLLLLPVVAAVLALGASSADALRVPAAPKCPVFPKSNPWNQRVDKLPVAANSAAITFAARRWASGPINAP